jgi:ribosome-binding factor A
VKGIRTERMGEELRRELSDVLISHAGDPRLSMVVVTRVDATRDLSHANVYVSVLGDDRAQEQSLRVLIKAAAFLRGELGRRLRLRRVPELRFRSDPGIRYSARLQQVLTELGLSDPEPVSGDADAEA